MKDGFFSEFKPSKLHVEFIASMVLKCIILCYFHHFKIQASSDPGLHPFTLVEDCGAIYIYAYMHAVLFLLLREKPTNHKLLTYFIAFPCFTKF